MHQTDNMVRRAGALHILTVLRRAGYETYWAGGCVRDHLMHRTPKDYDIVTAARPEEVQALFNKTVAIGKAFGVMGVIHEGTLFDVASFRKESGYADGRRPDSITFTDAREDALRRDFTINALFFDPIEERVLDYVGGQEDLERRCVRAVGDPRVRFAEDHLRMLRAVRFASTLDFTLEATTGQAIKELAPQLARISPERIREEFSRILLEASQPGDALAILLDVGLLEVFLPEVAALHGAEQPPQFHPEGDVFTHTRIMLNSVAPEEKTLDLVLATLLHDVGKPPTARVGPGSDGVERIRFDQHDAVGARMAEEILSRLRYPNAMISAVTHCVRNHMRFMHVQEMRRAKLRALIGAETFPTELALHRLDCLSSHGDLANYHFLVEQQAALDSEPALPRAWIRGEDLLALGIPGGPEIGRWLKIAYDQQLSGESPDRETLLNWLKEQINNDNDPA